MNQQKKIPFNLFSIKTVAGTAVFVLFCGLFLSSCVAEDKSLKVMNYNIRVGVGGAKERLPVREGLNRVKNVVEDISPDVLFTQETEKGAGRTDYVDQIDWFMTELNFQHGGFAPAIKEATWEYGVAVFSKFDSKTSVRRIKLFKPDYSETHPEYPDYFSEQRVLCEFKQEIDGQLVYFYNTHLGLTADQRQKQIEEIASIIREVSDEPVILGGDFNAEADAPEMAPLHELMSEAFSAADVPREERKTFPGGLAPNKAIDTFFVTDSVEIKDVWTVRDETLASDHNPVIMEVIITK
jgi:endonuclease/exonuclease/phosphatase family metal-dependent hydrolase